MKKKYLQSLFFILIFSTFVTAQDNVFSQFYAAPLQLNPAFTGNTYTPHFALNYRNQWPSFKNAYVTYAATYDQFFEPLNSGFGLMVTSDNLGNGVYKENSVGGFFAYRLKINSDWKLKIGVEATFAQRQLNFDKLTFGDQIDKLYGFSDGAGNANPTGENRPSQLTKSFLDISSGLLVYSKQFYGGLTVKHLNTPDYHFFGINKNSYRGLPFRTTLHAGWEIPIQKETRHSLPIFVSPSVIATQQGNFRQVNAGAYLGLGMFYTGAWFRHTFTNSDAVIFLVGVKKDWLKVGYSYDVTVSKLAAYNTGGSHELSLILNFDGPEETNYNDCFNIFR